MQRSMRPPLVVVPPYWTAAVDTEGDPRPLEEAAVAEITGLLPASTLAAYPSGTRMIVRSERPHPGAHSI